MDISSTPSSSLRWISVLKNHVVQDNVVHDDLLTPQKAQETRLRRPCYWKMLVHSPLHIRHIRPSFPGQTSCFFFCGLKAKRQRKQGFFCCLISRFLWLKPGQEELKARLELLERQAEAWKYDQQKMDWKTCQHDLQNWNWAEMNI